MKVPLYSREGNKKGEVVLNPAIYASRVNPRLLELVQRGYRANLRRGTASTKERSDVHGGGRKPWRQKGTGRARVGSIRSPIWKGGGTTFGPHPRDYSVALAKSVRNKALISALSLKASQKNLLLVEDVSLNSAKTREWMEIMKALPIKSRRALCVVREVGMNLKRASRNARHFVEVQRVGEFNAHHVLQRDKLVIEHEALAVIEERLLSAAQKARGGDSGGESS